MKPKAEDVLEWFAMDWREELLADRETLLRYQREYPHLSKRLYRLAKEFLRDALNATGGGDTKQP